MENVSTRQRLFPNNGTVFRIQLQKKIANIGRIERGGIRAMKFKAARLRYLSDAFVAVAVAVLVA